MNADTSLRDLADAHGVHTGFSDLQGEYRAASPETLRALLLGLGVPAATQAEVAEALLRHRRALAESALPQDWVVTAFEPATRAMRVPCTWSLTSEAGAVVAEGRVTEGLMPLPALPVGYFALHVRHDSGEDRCLVLSRPPRAPAVAGPGWGVTGALYGLRSTTNGGLGSYRDLDAALQGALSQGAQFLGINPVHALGWAMQDIISPYSPSHRQFLNIDHIALPDGLGPTPQDALIDYPAFRRRHRPALETAFASVASTEAFKTWFASIDDDLRRFAEFEALSERHGADFRTWPAALRTPGADASRAAGPRTQFHAWLQGQATAQIGEAQSTARAAGSDIGLYLDLAVGPRPDGAEVWMNADTMARGVTIGAPPDHLSPAGQSWALSAFAPGPLAAADYRPFRALLAQAMSCCGLLRIDHALGLLRSFWLPDDGSPGGYITQPFESLLAVIAIEADRTGCVVVGEDLGLVPHGFRDRMNAAGLYSYAVWQFEAGEDGGLSPVQDLPAHSLACFGTHDTPTLRGYWYGHDIAWWQRVGWIGSGAAQQRLSARATQRDSLRTHGGLAASASDRQISEAVHAALARAPSRLVAVTLDDIFGELEAQNLPGTIGEHPNWRRRLSVPVEEFATAPDLGAIAAGMSVRSG